MEWKSALLHAWHVVMDLLTPLVPGAIGAAVGQMWEPGLSLRQRLIQWFVGLAFAVFIVPGVGHVFHWDAPVTRAVGFFVATIAFKAVVPIQIALIDGASGSLRSLPEVFRSWTRKPGAQAETPDSPGAPE